MYDTYTTPRNKLAYQTAREERSKAFMDAIRWIFHRRW